MVEKKILNNTAKAINLKIDNKSIGRANIQLVPGYNLVSAKVHKALKALDYCKQCVEDDLLDFSPKPNSRKKPKPVTTVDYRLVKDPATPLGPKTDEEETEN